MENSDLSKHTVSYGLALALASVVNGLLVVAKESSPAVQAGMQKLTGHHSVTHCAIVLGLFFLTGWRFARARGGQGARLTAHRLLVILVSGVILGVLIIAGFYLTGD